jgi:tryptophan synthase alpha subunit
VSWRAEVSVNGVIMGTSFAHAVAEDAAKEASRFLRDIRHVLNEIFE